VLFSANNRYKHNILVVTKEFYVRKIEIQMIQWWLLRVILGK